MWNFEKSERNSNAYISDLIDHIETDNEQATITTNRVVVWVYWTASQMKSNSIAASDIISHSLKAVLFDFIDQRPACFSSLFSSHLYIITPERQHSANQD